MKQTEHNEIDLLIRGLARREGSAALEDNSAEHLDADELNSYAEQALPAAARARYTSHLAECASCRKIVSELTASSGVNDRDQSVSQKTSAGLWQKLGVLFATGPWRYAVPALALFAFMAVGLVVYRQQTQPEFVASTQPAAAQREGAIETKQAPSTVEPNKSATTNDQRQFDSFQQDSAKGRDNQAKTGERTETSKTLTGSLSDDVTGKDASLGKAAKPVAQPTYAPEPATAPPPKSQPTDTESRTEVATRQKKEADKPNEEPAREQAGARGRTAESQNQVARPAPRRDSLDTESDKRVSTPASKPGPGEGAKAKNDEADTRTVSGRQFRRQGGIWIDTAFQSSSATTLLTRGSEQFRALVADEPGIRAIATQLPGEVVVVWKGRAYRIR